MPILLPQIPTQNLEIYSRCPKKLEFHLSQGTTDTVPLSTLSLALKTIITSAYLKKSRTGKESPWRQVTSAVDKLVYTKLPRRSHPDYEKAASDLFNKSIKYIKQVKKAWYDPYYLSEDFSGFPDLKIGKIIDDTLVHDSIDLVLYNERELVVCTFMDVEPNLPLMYNNIRLRSQALMISRELNKPVTKLRAFSWSTKTDLITVKDLNIHKQLEFMNKTERSMRQIVRGIKNKAFYPSINAQCASCQFVNVCSF